MIARIDVLYNTGLLVWPWISPLRGWANLIMGFLGKLSYIWLTILSCYGTIRVPCGDWEGWWFEHSV